MEDSLRETAVLAALQTRWIGRHYQFLATVDSTNRWLQRSGGELPTGAVVLADFQSEGKGRFNRRWEAAPGVSLLLSILFRPAWPAEQSNWLVMATGVAAAEAMEQVAEVGVGLKWPNDLVIERQGVWRKAGGILLEGEMAKNGRLRRAIVGIGINVNTPLAQLPPAATATSLLLETGRSISRQQLLVAFLQRLEAHYETADRGNPSQMAWNRRLVTLGRSVIVTGSQGHSSLVGLAEDTDEWGRLLVRDQAGRRHAVAAGDVTLRRTD